MSNPSRWPNEELESSHFRDTSNIRSVGFYSKIKNLWFAFAFVVVLGCGLFGFLAAKEKILAVAADFDPSIFVTVWCGSTSLFHGYLANSKHSHWIKNAAIDALEKWFCFALRYFRYQSQEWIRDLSQLQHRAINIALVTGLILVSFVLFGDAYYQVIFDLDKTAIVRLHATQFSICSLCLCTGVYSSVSFCCVFRCMPCHDKKRSDERVRAFREHHWRCANCIVTTRRYSPTDSRKKRWYKSVVPRPYDIVRCGYSRQYFLVDGSNASFAFRLWIHG